jgi:hypothetical protein
VSRWQANATKVGSGGVKSRKGAAYTKLSYRSQRAKLAAHFQFDTASIAEDDLVSKSLANLLGMWVED